MKPEVLLVIAIFELPVLLWVAMGYVLWQIEKDITRLYQAIFTLLVYGAIPIIAFLDLIK